MAARADLTTLPAGDGSTSSGDVDCCCPPPNALTKTVRATATVFKTAWIKSVSRKVVATCYKPLAVRSDYGDSPAFDDSFDSAHHIPIAESPLADHFELPEQQDEAVSEAHPVLAPRGIPRAENSSRTVGEICPICPSGARLGNGRTGVGSPCCRRRLTLTRRIIRTATKTTSMVRLVQSNVTITNTYTYTRGARQTATGQIYKDVNK